LALVALSVGIGSAGTAEAALPAGFQKTTVLEGLHYPTQVEFSSDGRVFVAEQRGTVQVFDDLDDPTPTLAADLREAVHSYHDRGLLGLALDPNFPEEPYVYVLYTRNADVGGEAPKWTTPSSMDPELDGCPNPPGGTQDGCVVSGRLARLELGPDGTAKIGSDGAPEEHVLIDDWCQQFDTHSIGDLAFDDRGRLYVSGGDGANYNYADYGQAGVNGPFNPCGDPPTPVGTAPNAHNGEGGALRSQDLLTRGDPTGLDGTIIRINRRTGKAVRANPLFGDRDENAARIIAFGLRNPFRFTIRPGTDEVWVGDVGQTDWEEINRVPASQKRPANFGWPCYEGFGKQAMWAFLGNAMCNRLYNGSDPVRAPHLALSHYRGINAAEECRAVGTSAVSGVAFAPDSAAYPKAYRRALFFADYSRGCIGYMPAKPNGRPNADRVAAFDTAPGFPVDLEFGPDGALYYVDILAGEVRRIAPGDDSGPRAVVKVSPRHWGELPLTLTLDASDSIDPKGADLQYWWELDGDGDFNDLPTGDQPVIEHTFTEPGPIEVGVAIFETETWQDAQATVTIYPGNTPPEPKIEEVRGEVPWTAGSELEVVGSAADAEDGELGDWSLEWDVKIQHCPKGACHQHPLNAWRGKEMSFVTPDHEWPSHLEVELRATDSQGLSATETIELHPESVQLALRSKPKGLRLSAGGQIKRTPFKVRLIKGGGAVVVAPKQQRKAKRVWRFRRWAQGKPRKKRVLNISATQDQVLRAQYKAKPKKRNKGKRKKGKRRR
jgi:glucose/arabinose dehydrogenase